MEKILILDLQFSGTSVRTRFQGLKAVVFRACQASNICKGDTLNKVFKEVHASSSLLFDLRPFLTESEETAFGSRPISSREPAFLLIRIKNVKSDEKVHD